MTDKEPVALIVGASSYVGRRLCSRMVTGEVNIIHIAGPESNNRYEFAKKLARIMGMTLKKSPGAIYRKVEDIFPLIRRLGKNKDQSADYPGEIRYAIVKYATPLLNTLRCH